jgi:hypothetical protein
MTEFKRLTKEEIETQRSHEVCDVICIQALEAAYARIDELEPTNLHRSLLQINAEVQAENAALRKQLVNASIHCCMCKLYQDHEHNCCMCKLYQDHEHI